jgi:hypothetical protein
MRRIAEVGLVALLLAGITGIAIVAVGQDELSGTPAEIEKAIADSGCADETSHEEVREGDSSYLDFDGTSTEQVVIRCEQGLGDVVLLAGFATADELRTAMTTVKHGPAERTCLAERELFTTRFDGAKMLCESLGGSVVMFGWPRTYDSS